MVLKIHTSPIESPLLGCGLNLENVNRAGYDIAHALKADTVFRAGNWLVSNKTKTWALIDLMIVYCGTSLPTSFSDLSGDDLEDLFTVCFLCATAASKYCPVVYVGANISRSVDPRYFSRLHLHVTSLTSEEIADMSDVTGDELKERESAVLDPKARVFAQAFSGELGCEEYEFGVRKRLEYDLSDLNNASFLETIKAIDKKIGQTFGDLAYSFCVRFNQNGAVLNLVPRSVFGKGVLESDGIILERTSDKKFNADQLIKKLAFVKEVRTGLSSKFDDLGGGEYIKNLEKRIQGEKNG